MKKETYTFIIGLGIGYSVNKFMNKQVSDIQSAMIVGIKRKISDGFYKILWGQTPEQYCESGETYRKRESPYGYKNGRHTISHLDLITFETREYACQVLNEMRAFISDYGQCSVGDYYEIIGRYSNFTDDSRGWTDLENAHILSHHGEFYIDLPTPKLLR